MLSKLGSQAIPTPTIPKIVIACGKALVQAPHAFFRWQTKIQLQEGPATRPLLMTPRIPLPPMGRQALLTFPPIYKERGNATRNRPTSGQTWPRFGVPDGSGPAQTWVVAGYGAQSAGYSIAPITPLAQWASAPPATTVDANGTSVTIPFVFTIQHPNTSTPVPIGNITVTASVGIVSPIATDGDTAYSFTVTTQVPVGQTQTLKVVVSAKDGAGMSTLPIVATTTVNGISTTGPALYMGWFYGVYPNASGAPSYTSRPYIMGTSAASPVTAPGAPLEIIGAMTWQDWAQIPAIANGQNPTASAYLVVDGVAYPATYSTYAQQPSSTNLTNPTWVTDWTTPSTLQPGSHTLAIRMVIHQTQGDMVSQTDPIPLTVLAPSYPAPSAQGITLTSLPQQGSVLTLQGFQSNLDITAMTVAVDGVTQAVWDYGAPIPMSITGTAGVGVVGNPTGVTSYTSPDGVTLQQHSSGVYYQLEATPAVVAAGAYQSLQLGVWRFDNGIIGGGTKNVTVTGTDAMGKTFTITGSVTFPTPTMDGSRFALCPLLTSGSTTNLKYASQPCSGGSYSLSAPGRVRTTNGPILISATTGYAGTGIIGEILSTYGVPTGRTTDYPDFLAYGPSNPLMVSGVHPAVYPFGPNITILDTSETGNTLPFAWVAMARSDNGEVAGTGASWALQFWEAADASCPKNMRSYPVSSSYTGSTSTGNGYGQPITIAPYTLSNDTVFLVSIDPPVNSGAIRCDLIAGGTTIGTALPYQGNIDTWVNTTSFQYYWKPDRTNPIGPTPGVAYASRFAYMTYGPNALLTAGTNQAVTALVTYSDSTNSQGPVGPMAGNPYDQWLHPFYRNPATTTYKPLETCTGTRQTGQFTQAPLNLPVDTIQLNLGPDGLMTYSHVAVSLAQIVNFDGTYPTLVLGAPMALTSMKKPVVIPGQHRPGYNVVVLSGGATLPTGFSSDIDTFQPKAVGRYFVRMTLMEDYGNWVSSGGTLPAPSYFIDTIFDVTP